jgi:pimeloyl-ACP methyl ester carboxylesterase
VTPMSGALRVGQASRLDVKIHYEVFGEGPPVVLVAGLGDDRLSWQAQVEELQRAHEVIVFDNRGIGKSTIVPGPYEIRDMSEDCHTLVESLGVSGVTAIGSSMGGAICQLWALEHPQDVDRLILTNTWGRRDPFLEALFSHWIRLGEQGKKQAIAESLLLFCYSPEFLEANPRTVDEFLASELPDLTGFIAASHACRSHELGDRAQDISQPTLVIAGEHDILTRPQFSHELAAQIPKSELETLSTGHMIFWERPTEFINLVHQFLTSSLD